MSGFTTKVDKAGVKVHLYHGLPCHGTPNGKKNTGTANGAREYRRLDAEARNERTPDHRRSVKRQLAELLAKNTSVRTKAKPSKRARARARRRAEAALGTA